MNRDVKMIKMYSTDKDRNKRKVSALLALLLVLVMGMSLLAGCGDGAADPADEEKAGVQTEQNDGNAAADPDGGSGGSDSAAGESVRTGADVDDSGSEGKSDSSEGQTSRTFTDDCGREVSLPAELTQVVSSGALAQIMIYAIAPDSLMATPGKWSREARHYVPEKYWDLPEIGSFFGSHDLNYEEVAKLSPQVVVDVGEDKPDMKADLEDITSKTGVPAVHITANYNDLDQAFDRLGELFGRTEEGKKLSEYCSEAYEDVEKTMDKVRKKKTVMYCTQEDGLNVIAKDSYHSQVIDLIGDNVSELSDPSSQGSGNEVNLEQMMLWDPEVIIFAPGSYYDYVSDDPGWAPLRAIKSGRYYEVPFGPYNWMGSPPSSNRLLGMLWMAKLLYPKQADFDMKDRTKTYYELFYHYTLGDGEYARLVKKSLGK